MRVADFSLIAYRRTHGRDDALGERAGLGSLLDARVDHLLGGPVEREQGSATGSKDWIWFCMSSPPLPLATPADTPRRQFTLLRIPRARRVHQSYLTSPFTTLYSLAYCLWHISLSPLLVARRDQRCFADLILLNGPGSCVPIACAAFLPRVSSSRCRITESRPADVLTLSRPRRQLLALPSPSLVYIESLARTRRLSVSAKLVRPLVDRFFVQWETLRDVLKEGDAKRKVGAWRLKAEVEWEGWLV